MTAKDSGANSGLPIIPQGCILWHLADQIREFGHNIYNKNAATAFQRRLSQW